MSLNPRFVLLHLMCLTFASGSFEFIYKVPSFNFRVPDRTKYIKNKLVIFIS